ncbi:MAG TPA: succinate dehydrogenase assembly factor 2 [Burkholderiaceae bacterium]|nr:succinate dehydrogenase assembly factor 2 [Burkholderiaceae bacterium]
MNAATTRDPDAIRRLRWRARRGLLENDLLLTRFLDRHEKTLDAEQTAALLRLLELPDNELLDLLLGRQPLAPGLDTTDVREVLALLRTA